MSNVQRMEAISNVKKRKYKCPFCDNRYDRVRMITHIEKKHPEYISDDYTATRIVFNLVNKKEKGTCVMCGKESPWNEEKGRYDRFCSPECVKAYTKLADRRLKDVTGKTKQELLKDPEYQNKVMLSHRSISGEYTFQDGSKKKYVGTYEKNFLRFMDVFLNIKSEDIETPGPIIDYEYKGKKHKWITDAYYAPYNLVFDIKDGGDNPNNREMSEYRAKQDAKEDAIKKLNKYNYIRLTDNKFEQLIQLMMELKELYVENNGAYNPIIRINESYIINEIDNSEDNEMIGEGYLLNKKDIYYNKDKFDSGEINLCFITGHSGSGKTTMGRYMQSEKNVETYELDDLIFNYNFSDDNLKEYGNLIYSFFKGVGKQFRYHSKKELYDNHKWDDTSVYNGYEFSIITSFVNYAIKYAKSHKNTKFVLEGIWIYMFFEPKYFEDYAVYIKGTSVLISNLRAARRDSKDGKNKLETIKNRVRESLRILKYHLIDEKDVSKFYNYFKSKMDKGINESTMIEDNMITEAVIFDKDDAYYNFDKFVNGQCNILFITGFSGGGKTTLTKEYSKKYKAEIIEIDNFECYMNRVKKDDGSVYSEFLYKTDFGKEYMERYMGLTNTSVNLIFQRDFTNEMMKFLLEYCGKRKNQKFIIEGMQVFRWEDYQKIKDYALIIKGTSALTSAIRRIKRNKEEMSISHILELMRWYVKDDKMMNKLHKVYKESSLDNNIDTIVFDIGDVLLRCDSEYIFSNYKMLNNKQKEEALSLLDKDYDEYSLEEILLYIDEHFPDLSNHKDELIDLYSQIDPYDYTYDLLNTLKNRGYKLYYLSNWSKWGIELLKMQNKLGFLDIFDDGLFSYEINMRKPDKNIYEYFINKFDIIPDRTIFFDDKRKNIEAAKEIGMNAYEFNYEEYDYILNSYKSLQESINNSSILTEKGSYILLKEYVEPNSLTVYDEYTYSTIDSAIRLEQLYNQNIHCYSYDRNTDTVNYLGEMNVIQENDSYTVNWIDEIAQRGYIAEQLMDEDYNSFVNEEAVYDDKHKNPIYVILMSGVSPLSYAIKKFTKGEYTHCCISFNSKLTPFYSFGMKENLSLKDMGFSILNPRVKEYQNNKVKFAVYTMFVSDNQRKKMIQRLKWFKEKEAFLGYDFIGLIKYVLNRSSDGNLEKWFCSRFVMEILGQGIKIGRDASLYSPQQVKDELTNISLVNKGDNFYEYDHRITDKNVNDIKNGRYNYNEE